MTLPPMPGSGHSAGSTPGSGHSAGSTPGSGHADPDAQVFVISVAAQLAGMHAQTLRTYDRLGLVTPHRTTGGGRRYSPRDVALLREVQRLSQNEGVNLEGIKRIIELTNQVEALQVRVTELAQELANVHASYRRDLVPVQRSALVVWKPRHQR